MMDILQSARDRIYNRGLKIVMPEGHDPRVCSAAEQLRAEKLAEPILISLDPSFGRQRKSARS